MTKPVVIRGISYSSAKLAAIALGVSPQTIAIARQNNRLANVGLGLHGNVSGNSNRRETILCGIVYKSRADAASAIGVPLSQLSSFLTIAAKLGIDVHGCD
jgi:hypothetical protein